MGFGVFQQMWVRYVYEIPQLEMMEHFQESMWLVETCACAESCLISSMARALYIKQASCATQERTQTLVTNKGLV